MDRWRRVGLFGALYVAQGVPFGFVTVAIPIHLATRVEQGSISSLVATVLLPWSLKWLVAPIIDRVVIGRFGRRRPWILIGQLGMGATLAGLIGVDPVQARAAFIGLLLAHNAFAALQDIAVDAWAVDIVPDQDRGAVQSVMFAGKYIGIAAGGAPLSWMIRHHGFAAVAGAQAIMILAIGSLVLFAREAEAAAGERRLLTWKALVATFTMLAPGLALLYAVVDRIGTNMVGAVMLPLVRGEAGYSPASAELASAWMLGGTTVGCLLGGVVSDHLGRRRTIALATLVTAALYLTFAVTPGLRGSFGILCTFLVAMSLAEGFLITAQNSLFMDLCNPAIGGTQFTAYMSASNICGAWSIAASGPLAGEAGRLGVIAVAAAAQLAGLVFLRWLDPRTARFD
jgi:MFS transporter, PAT family, beta-lactamase induction signal transducer AmpG